MESILKKLWYGNTDPYNDYLSNDPEVRHLIDLINKNKQCLERTLNKKQFKILENLLYCSDEYNLLTTEAAFCCGFSMGTKITVESLKAK